MDLNYLLHRQQIERFRAESAPSMAARNAHKELAGLYEEAIERVSKGKLRFQAEGDATLH